MGVGGSPSRAVCSAARYRAARGMGSLARALVASLRGPRPRAARLSARPVAGSRVPVDELFAVDGVLSAPEAAALVAEAEGAGAFARSTTEGMGPGYAFRDHGRASCESAEAAKLLWDRLGRGASLPLPAGAAGLNPAFRLYRYEGGGAQRFGAHVDESVEVAGGLRTGYTLLVYLSEVAAGGHTVFYGHGGVEVARVRPRPGLALLHVHGDRCLEHEAEAVAEGCKYVLRSDVVFHTRRRPTRKKR